jgi:uncharacterized protein involved in exopolysaccharide biosynthesis
MRVYGTSPLHRYVELVCRSWRLFLVSVLVATVATVALYLYRAHSYTATGLILLSGNRPGEAALDVDAGNSIQYKLSILNVVLRDPKSLQEALRAAGMNRGMTEVEFREFAREAHDALSYATGDNLLEITCHWRDARASDIVSAFIAYYRQQVRDNEDKSSIEQTDLLKTLLADYEAKQDTVEKNVVAYQTANYPSLPMEPDAASNQFQQQQHEVIEREHDLQLEHEKLQLIGDQLAHTQKMYTASLIRQGPGEDPQYLAALEAQRDADKKLAALRLAYTDNAPKVKEAQAELDQANAQVQKYAAAPAPGADKPGKILKTEENYNPSYLNLQNQYKAEQLVAQGMEMRLQQARQDLGRAQAQARTSPDAQYNYRRLTDNLSLYASLRQNLAAQLEQSKIDQQKIDLKSLAGVKPWGDVILEADRSSSKGLLLLAGGPLLGLLVAFGFSLLAESLDHSLRTPLDVELQLGKPVLAVLPNRGKALRNGAQATLRSWVD